MLSHRLTRAEWNVGIGNLLSNIAARSQDECRGQIVFFGVASEDVIANAQIQGQALR